MGDVSIGEEQELHLSGVCDAGVQRPELAGPPLWRLARRADRQRKLARLGG
jgi:hypothetical protein